MWKKQRKRKRRQIEEEEAAAMRGRKGEDEGDTRRKKIERSGTRKARKRSPMEAKVYDASPAGVTDATTEALFQVGFLASCAPLPLPFPSLPLLLLVRYTYVTTLGTRSRVLLPVSRLRYILSAVTM